jgi:hypothetical protein
LSPEFLIILSLQKQIDEIVPVTNTIKEKITLFHKYFFPESQADLSNMKYF